MSKFDKIQELRRELRALEEHMSTASGSAAEWLDQRINAIYAELKALEEA